MPAQPFSRFFHHTAIARQGKPTESDEKKGTGYFFFKKEKISTHGQNNRKSSLSPFPREMLTPIFSHLELMQATL
jgi:hypothetical protein